MLLRRLSPNNTTSKPLKVNKRMLFGTYVNNPRDLHGTHMMHTLFLNVNGTEGKTRKVRCSPRIRRVTFSPNCRRLQCTILPNHTSSTPVALTTMTLSVMVEAWMKCKVSRAARADKPRRMDWDELTS